MKVTVYGGTNNTEYTAVEKEDCERLGAFLAKNGIEILTGACYGFPYYVGRAAVLAGGSVIGYSPALDLKEHVDKYKFPTDGTTKLEFIEKKGETKADNFLRRSMDMTAFSDVVIAMGGSWGTYSELIFSLFYKKTIILIDKYDGATRAFWQTWNLFDRLPNNPHVHQGAKIFVVKDIDEACEVVLKQKK